MNREQIEYFKGWVRDWDFELFPTMPIRKIEAEYLVKLFDQMDKEREKKHQWYVENRQDHNNRMKDYYQESKAKAFIKGAKND